GIDVAAAVAGPSNSLAVDAQGHAWTWGANGSGQLGDGTRTDRAAPARLPNPNSVLAVAAEANFCTVLKSDGTLWSWGDDSFGNFGNGASTSGNQSTPVRMNALHDITTVSAGFNSCLAVDGHGQVWGWGDNSYGQLGDGTAAFHLAPDQIFGPTGVVAVSTGDAGLFSVALDNQGNVWAWGYNGGFELGDGSMTNKLAPEKISGLTNVIAIAASDHHSLALKSDGTVWIFGTINYQDGSSAAWPTPTQVVGLTAIKAISVGDDFSLALDNQGNVWAWGYNGDGELGDPTLVDHTTPWQVSSLSNVVAISTRSFNSLALKNDGTIWEWGIQYWPSETFNPTSPTQVQSGLTGAKALASGETGNLVLKNDGTVWAWGANDSGQLGDGTTTDQSEAVKVGNLEGETATAIVEGNGYNLEVTAEGTVKGWGARGLFDLSLPVPAEAAIRLIPWADDSTQNGMSDAWEIKYFGSVSHNGLGDTNSDGLTDIEEYVEGADPTLVNSSAVVDFFGGMQPVLTSLVDPSGMPGPEGLVQIKVTRASDGTPLVNAPVALAVTTGASLISATEGGQGGTQVNVQTDSSGVASAYINFNSFAPDVLVATVLTVSQTVTLSVNLNLTNALGQPQPPLPDMLNDPQPNPAPTTIPGGWDVFTPPVSSQPAGFGTPTIAEWTRTGASDDSLIMTGDAFSNLTGTGQGKDTQFLVYGQTGGGDAVQAPASILRLDGMKAAVNLPAGLPAWSTYFVWPGNSAGYGVPVAVNRTDAWWLSGPRVDPVSLQCAASPGDTVSVYGRNLAHSNGTVASWVYLQAAGGSGQWATVTSVNPYRVQFTVPGAIASGTYEVWIHNGHGGNYGWSNGLDPLHPLTLTVAAPFTWDSDTNGVFNPNASAPANFNVKASPYNAVGDGITDDSGAILRAYLDAVSYIQAHPEAHPTLYFPAGTYSMSQGLGVYRQLRYRGDGKDLTILQCNPVFGVAPRESPSGPSTGLFAAGANEQYASDAEIRDMTLDANGNLDPNSFGTYGYVLNCNWNNYPFQNLRVTNVRIKTF
ncbi:MAG: glycosyl hydrolase family 28-related protein, partial [Opitutaceae bacterium]